MSLSNILFNHPVCSIEGVKERLEALQLRPNKALGQNFLIDADARRDILGILPAQPAPVLEIGPGLGALTEGLLERGASPLLAVDKDEAMIRLLSAGFANKPRLITVHADILRLEYDFIKQTFEGSAFYAAGNLPYYITTPIALRLLSGNLPILSISLMVQLEAAQRFWAAPGDLVYGPLAVAAQSMYNVQRGCRLPPAAFYPRPAVSSCCVRLTNRREGDFTGFVPFLKQAFAMRRKTLLNNLINGAYEKQAAMVRLEALNIPPDTRAEALCPERLYALFRLFAAK